MIKQLLLILSFTFGVAFTAFATPKAGTVIEQGKIINKEYRSYKDDDGKTVWYWELIVAYDSKIYRCTINKEHWDVECLGYSDRGARLTQGFPNSLSVFAARRRQENEETTTYLGIYIGLGWLCRITNAGYKHEQHTDKVCFKL